MATTPPPAKRIRTPPTPLHGSKYDNYEPYSPRRSSRIASLNASPPTTGQSKRYRNHNGNLPAAIRARGSVNQAFSPPLSPASPARHGPGLKQDDAFTLSPPKQRRARLAATDDSDTDPFRPSSRSRLSNRGPAMLPTPAKTPRKRNVTGEVLDTTARVLFPTASSRLGDGASLTKRSGTQSLDMVHSSGGRGGKDEITIYTDTKERIPEVDESPSNPFYFKNKCRARREVAPVSRSDESNTPRKQKRQSKELVDEIAEMERKVQNDEGIIYVFRGRKVFRRFDDAAAHDASASDSEDMLNNNSILKRQAGAAAHGRLTRHSLAPRRLFPASDPVPTVPLGAEADDEEAETDIELPLSSPNNLTKVDTEHDNPVTGEIDANSRSPSSDRPELSSESSQSGTRRAKRISPFASWPRTKPSTRSATPGAKRERETGGSATDQAPVSKRIRSGVHERS